MAAPATRFVSHAQLDFRPVHTWWLRVRSGGRSQGAADSGAASQQSSLLRGRSDERRSCGHSPRRHRKRPTRRERNPEELVKARRKRERNNPTGKKKMPRLSSRHRALIGITNRRLVCPPTICPLTVLDSGGIKVS